MQIETAGAAFQSGQACGADPGPLCEWVYSQTDNERLAEVTSWLAGTPLRIVLILAGAWLIIRLLRAGLSELMEQIAVANAERQNEPVNLGEGMTSAERTKALELRSNQQVLVQRQRRARQRALTLGSVLSSIVGAIVWLIAVVMVLSELDVSLGPLLAGAGVVGIAIGFGAQQIVRDFLAGFFIIIEDQYGVGDVVDLGEANGTVEEVTMRVTRLRDVAGALWVVPNGEIHRVANKSQLWARCVLDVEVTYDTDIDKASEILLEVATELWHEQDKGGTILGAPQVWGVQALRDTGVQIRLALKTEPAEQFAVARELRRRIKTAFQAEGIEIPIRKGLWAQDTA